MKAENPNYLAIKSSIFTTYHFGFCAINKNRIFIIQKFTIMNKIISLLFLSILFFSEAQTPDKNVALNSIKNYSGAGSNICGYVDSLGNEYALFGWTGGVDIVNVTNPSAPVSVFNIPGLNSIWREIKVNGDYAYITTEAGGATGLQIAYLGNLPAVNVPIVNWAPLINGVPLGRIHALHIDNNKVYLYGATANGGAPIVANIGGLNAANPILIGQYINQQPGAGNAAYVHDGYVRNDTLYSCHIYSGYVNIVKFNNIGDSVNYLAPSITTPTAFPHNTWLNASSKNLFTSDENGGSFLGCYDISNLSNIQEADRIQSQNQSSGSVIHNTHVLKNNVGEFAVTSWYRDGIVVTDVTRPTNIVNVGWYDTYTAGGGSGFDGCWGVYPFLPSGRLVTSGRDNTLHVLTPTYKRACYYEGTVIDSITNLPISNATVIVPQKTVATDLSGAFRTGSVDTSVIISAQKSGYVTKTFTKNLLRAGIVTDIIKLVPIGSGLINSLVARDIELYPNPVEDIFYIKNKFTNAFQYAYKIYDISNRIIVQGAVTNHNQEVSTQNLNNGFYFVSVEENGEEIMKVKLIKY
jgi:choice-of-anchor B domain-containing protein